MLDKTRENKIQANVDIVIPHYNGKEMLRTCLSSLQKSTGVNFRVILVDNGSSDGSPEMVEREFPQVEIIRNRENLGYAGGCNEGFKYCSAPLVFFYNNDTEIKPDSLKLMVEFFASHPEAASAQPKILSMRYKGKFDYAGAAGGFIDRLGFPWCRGRMIDAIEEDNGQYDDIMEVFWTSGAAVMYRRSVLEKIGVFDLDFFAHMEEIDLNWRALNAGYRHFSLPGAVVYHYSGYTLGQGNKMKLFYNHRNNLLMILKNASWGRILWLYPLRLIMDLLMMVKALISRETDWALGIIKAFFAHFLLWPHVIGERKKQKEFIVTRKIPAKLVFPVSIIFHYFILKKRKFSSIWNKSDKIGL